MNIENQRIRDFLTNVRQGRDVMLASLNDAKSKLLEADVVNKGLEDGVKSDALLVFRCVVVLSFSGAFAAAAFFLAIAAALDLASAAAAARLDVLREPGRGGAARGALGARRAAA